MDNPRRLALNSLLKTDLQGAFTNIEINTTLGRSNMEKNDVSLYTFLYLGAVEKKLFLDSVISEYSSTPLDEIDAEALNILRLGLYQLIFADKIPDYSAVNESVNLAPKRSRGFVNAILREFLRKNKKITLPADKWDKLSCEASMPKELVKIFRHSYGDDVAEKIVTYQDKSKETSLRVNTLMASVDRIIALLKQRGYEPSYSAISEDIINCRVPIGEIADLIDGGIVFIQDEASRFCAQVMDCHSGEKVLDACACPGGKSFSMCIDMENEGEMLSCDLHKNKLSLITKGANRLGIEIIKAKEQNGKIFVPEYEGYFDKVLCDVPCSGLGVIFKKPDIKYKPIENINGLPCVQFDILSNCSKYVKIGGTLVYSTCTLNKRENEDNVLNFLQSNPLFEPYDFEINNIKSSGGMYTFFPHINGTDGFFVARMKRVK